MIPSRFGRLLGAALLLVPSMALGQSMIQQPNTGLSGSKAEPLPNALIKLYQNDVGLDSRLSTVEGTLNRVVGTVGSFGNAASKNVGVTVGTVADGGALTAETSRAVAAEAANASAISGEVTRATAAEAALQAAIGAATNAYAVNYTAQSLTGAQQLQARQNIGAAASGDTLVLGAGSTATTPAAGDNTTRVATTAFSTGALSSYASTVASTYLTQSTAASTYLSQSGAASTYAPLASPTFTGAPKAPTAAAGNNSTQLATTAYADRAATAAPYVVAESLGATGYRRWSDGYIEQWAQVTSANADFVFGFPLAFPNACWGVIASSMYTNDGSTAFVISADTYTKSSAIIRARIIGNGGAVTGQANLPITLRVWGN